MEIKKIKKKVITVTIDETIEKALRDLSKGSKAPFSYVVNYILEIGLKKAIEQEKEEEPNKK